MTTNQSGDLRCLHHLLRAPMALLRVSEPSIKRNTSLSSISQVRSSAFKAKMVCSLCYAHAVSACEAQASIYNRADMPSVQVDLACELLPSPTQLQLRHSCCSCRHCCCRCRTILVPVLAVPGRSSSPRVLLLQACSKPNQAALHTAEPTSQPASRVCGAVRHEAVTCPSSTVGTCRWRAACLLLAAAACL